MDKEITALLEELMLNVPSYGNQIEGKKLLSFLIEWKNTFAHSHTTPDQYGIFLKELKEHVTSIRKTIIDPIAEYRASGDAWVSFGEGWQPTTTIDDLIYVLNRFQNPPTSFLIPHGDIMM